MYTMCDSTTFALRHTQISLSGILRHFRPPSRHLLLHTHDTNMEFLQQSLEFVAETRIFAEMKIENRGKFFFRGKTNWQTYFFFFFKQSVGVAESKEITPWTNVSLPAKSSVNGVIVRGHLHILSYFRDGSIRPVLIGQKKFVKPMNIDFAFEA